MTENRFSTMPCVQPISRKSLRVILQKREVVSLELSLARLIRKRMQDLGITRGELARRMGYSNIRKGCHRIALICAGDLFLARTLREALSRGLGVDAMVIERSIDTSYTEQTDAKKEEYRQSFKPHAVVVTVLGGPEYFPCMIFPTLRCSMRAVLPDELPLFLGSSTRGYVVNYSPDCAVYFDKEGKPIKRLAEALRVEISGRHG